MAQTWLITGTSTGFGKHLASHLAQQKEVNLVATARHTESLDYLDQYDHGQILKLQLDVTKPAQIEQVVKETVDRFGGIDVLDNNAGLGYFSSFEEANEKDVRYLFDVNVFGLAQMTQAVLPVMRQQKSGTILGLSSMAGLTGVPALSFYSGTKFAVEGMYEALAKEAAQDNIKVVLVEPSSFRTDWAGRSSNKLETAYPEDYPAVKQTMDGMAAQQGQEAGDPQKAAEIIYDLVANHQAELPLHLPLGAAAAAAGAAAVKDLDKDISQYTALAQSADFNNQ
ncbi:SDR family NAD(P)-dependent oxidoreductase [Leuconostocaceae bacterium ESL0958]|nr:SDR family NAD(P)-dependent oxidoreductase [Leuconostocaceae bacterium ESL0958]